MGRLSVKNLSVERAGRAVLNGIDADLEPGTITAICGPNGAGKSSLLMAMTGLLPAQAGDVALDQTSLSAMRPANRAQHIGYLPQSADIAWDVSVEALVALGRHPHGDAVGDSGKAAVAAALEACELQDLRTRRVTRLSGGETARALLARVLAGEPDWILADEPLAALDLAHQLRMVGHLRARAAAGQGVVIVLHDLTLAMNHADRVLVLKEGALIADGPPAEALSPEVIREGWGVTGQWLGEPGNRALSAR